MQPHTSMNRGNLKRLLLGSAIIGILLISLLIYQSLKFHVVSTTPSTDNFPASSPVLFVDFNKELAKTTLTTAWNPGVSSTYAINGKRLTINIQSALQVSKQYTVVITGVKSQAGEAAGDISYTFTPKDIAYNDLPKEIQQVLFRRQDLNQPIGRNSFAFDGTDALVKQGISTYQIEALKQAVFLFGQKSRITVTSASVDGGTITIPPYSTQSVPDYFTMTFGLTINKALYHATLLYNDVATLRVQLAAGNTQVYDSGDINGSTL